MALFAPVGWACARENIGERRTEHRGERPRPTASHLAYLSMLMNRNREPRGGRSLPLAVSKERPAGSWAALCPSPDRREEIRSWSDGRDGRGYQLRAAPTPLPFDRAGDILLSLVVFLPSVFALVLRV
jgi:hypothetical protein